MDVVLSDLSEPAFTQTKILNTPITIFQAQRNKEIRDQQAEQEERLAAELSRIKHEEMRDEKMRQHIRETSLELRELEAKLKAGYTNMERHAQMAEKEAIKYDKMVSRVCLN